MANTALLFLAAFGTGIMLCLFVRPMYGVYTYVGVFYLHPPSRWWGDVLPDLRWSLLAAVITLISYFIHMSGKQESDRPPWHRSGIIMILILYTAWMWLQAPWVLSAYHMEGVILFSKYTLLLFLLYSVIDNPNDFRGFCLAHLVGCAYFGLLVYLAPDAGRLEGVGGPGVNDANTLGMHLSTGLIFGGFLLLESRGWMRVAIAAMLPFVLNGIIQTETRGALVGLFLGGLATVYLKPKRFRRSFYFFAILGIFGFVAIANEAFVARMQSMTAAVDETEEWDSSAMTRIAIVNAQLEMFADHPLGVGHQGTAYLSRGYLEERWLAGDSGDRASHNTVMSVLVDQGLPGIILIGILALIVVRQLRRLKAMDRNGLPDRLGIFRTMVGGSIITIFGAGMFAQYVKAEVLIWTLCLLAILNQLARDAQPETDTKKNSHGLPVNSRYTPRNAIAKLDPSD